MIGIVLRLLVLIAVIWLILGFVKRLWRQPAAKPTAHHTISDMVKCDYCGVYLPSPEAIRHGRRVYCSTRHRDAVGGPQD